MEFQEHSARHKVVEIGDFGSMPATIDAGDSKLIEEKGRKGSIETGSFVCFASLPSGGG